MRRRYQPLAIPSVGGSTSPAAAAPAAAGSSRCGLGARPTGPGARPRRRSPHGPPPRRRTRRPGSSPRGAPSARRRCRRPRRRRTRPRGRGPPGRNSSQKRSRGTVRSPSSTSAPSASSATPTSPYGRPASRLPPIVAMLRSAGPPTSAAAGGQRGHVLKPRDRGERDAVAPRTVRPPRPLDAVESRAGEADDALGGQRAGEHRRHHRRPPGHHRGAARELRGRLIGGVGKQVLGYHSSSFDVSRRARTYARGNPPPRGSGRSRRRTARARRPAAATGP